MLILGAHMSIAGGFAQAALKTGQEFACNAMQIFTKSPRSRMVKAIDPVDAKQFREYCRKYKIQHVVAHSSYLLNFGKKNSQIPWAISDIMLDFERLHALGGHGVVVHIGKSLEGERKTAITNVIENAKIIIEKTRHIGLEYILENTAGQGSEIGFQLEELGEIWKALKPFSPRIRSCLDTAHIWAAGYDISTSQGVKNTLKVYDELIGLDTLSCFHFNDSKKTLASRVDRHDNIGSGTIALEGLQAIAEFAKRKSIPLILETPEKDGKTHLDDILTVRGMLKE
ncbi:MAG: deoxyribonuclease IV [Candidatus Gracilibacteria bacterium]